MATIVQPYNPWREQLAVTALGKVAGDIIGDIWNTHKQNEQNRKANAFRGALQQEVGNIAQQQDISLTPKEVPQGYNSNPWANAFHQNNSPITQFDIGTSQRQPTIQDIAKIADNLAATPRFSALSPEVMQGVKNSMIQSNIANMFGNADNWGDKINAWGLGVANGLMPYQPMSALSQLYLHDNPHYDFSNVDIGTHNLTVARNPKDGTASPVLISPVGMSAYQRASLQTQRDIANIHARTQNYATDTNFKAEQIRGQSAAEAARYKFMSDILDKYNKGVDDEIAQLRTQLESAPDEQSAAYFQQQIDALTQQKKQYNDAFMSSFGMGANQPTATGATQATGQNPANSNDVWFGMVGNPKGISVHPHGTFGYDRGDHKHGGIDIPVVEGTDIKTMPEMGSTFTVKEARNHKSYGNTVVIESDRKFNGKTVQFRIAHMQDGSLNLKPGQVIKAGDIIGKVGSTGRSTGAHVHLEVIVDGQKVDPQTFFQNYTAQTQNPPQVTATGNLKPEQNTKPQNTQNAKSTARTATQKAPVTAWLNETDPSAYISTSDGNAYTKDEIEGLAKNQGLTLQEWLMKNNVQPYPELFPNATAPRDPVAYMSNRYGDYFTKDEVIREAARKNITQEDYENQLRAQGFSKAGEDFPNEVGQTPQVSALDSRTIATPPFPDSYSDKNRRNLTPYINRGHDRSAYYPAWNLADFIRGINSYQNSENTALGGNSPLSGDILNFGDDVIPQWAVLNDPFYYTKYKYGRYGR